MRKKGSDQSTPLVRFMLQAKIVAIGDEGVRKRTLCRTWIGGGFNTSIMLTIGADFASKERIFDCSQVKRSYNIKFQIWDLAEHVE